MLKKMLSLALAMGLCAPAMAAAGSEQLWTKDQLKSWDREKVAGGEGTLYGKFSFTRNEAAPDHAIKEIGWMTLQPGAGIGMHKHENNEDAYIIISGEGTFTDSDGKETVVHDGDVTLARKGQSHALKNTGKTPLIFLDIISQQ